MKTKNAVAIETADIEMTDYNDFYAKIVEKTSERRRHVVSMFSPKKDVILAFVADDEDHTIEAFGCKIDGGSALPSLTAERLSLHAYERDIHERWGTEYSNHPWLKPLRSPACSGKSIYDYPYYDIEGEALHQVGVGPIHAGIIEPGHFRFICEGETVLHLEIQLGWQRRGVVDEILKSDNGLKRAILSEQIAGDSTVAYSVAMAKTFEALAGLGTAPIVAIDRAIAIEQERIAIHTGDLSAICTDIGYQLGSAVFGRLRTPIINHFQKWSGSRFARALVRPVGSHFPLTDKLIGEWKETISKYLPDFKQMATEMFDLPSVLSRIERTGIVSEETAEKIGLVGMAARASNLKRDVRKSHPTFPYDILDLETEEGLRCGDVYSRAHLRYEEVLQSIELIDRLMKKRQEEYVGGLSDGLIYPSPDYDLELEPNKTVCTMVEGWRGQIVVVAQTDSNGKLSSLDVVDPSVHNWMGLQMAVRGAAISDFPICNKSFDLSYCGHDL
ncbi:MAG: NADH dehydrogenase subunit [Bacteroidales bacterium]|nr:NADH dehydrogenase subunit [Bacteroidales bacterium]